MCVDADYINLFRSVTSSMQNQKKEASEANNDGKHRSGHPSIHLKTPGTSVGKIFLEFVSHCVRPLGQNRIFFKCGGVGGIDMGLRFFAFRVAFPRIDTGTQPKVRDGWFVTTKKGFVA